MQNESTEQKMIDVVEDFSAPCQTEQYQKSFRNWRRQKQNIYAFRFTKNPKETAFSESQAVAEQMPSQAEQTVLRKLGYLAGCAFICYLVIENILDKLTIAVMQKMHWQIEIVFYGGNRIYGDEKLVFWVTTVIHLLKYLIPAVWIQKKIHLPMCVSVPLPVRKPNSLLSGMIFVMLLSVGLGMYGSPYSAELEKYRQISGLTASQDNKVILYTLITIFILPIVAELLLHGCLFQTLRQFGDTFAVVTMAILTAAMTHNIFDAVRMGIIHLVISYYLVKTGSFLSAVFLRIVHEIYMFALFCLEAYDMYTLEWWVILPCLLGIIISGYILLHKKEKPIYFSENATYLNMQEKLTAFLTVMPMVIFLIACVLILVITSILV